MAEGEVTQETGGDAVTGTSISVGRAILVGTVVVNLPVLALLFSPGFIFGLLEDKGVISRTYNWVGLLVIVVGFVLAWLWWSVSVPRWRSWAYDHVENIRLLKERAVGAGLVWRDGQFFGKTEIKSKATLQREREVEALASLKHALSGVAHSQLRQASVEVDSTAHVIRVRFEYDGEPEPAARENCEIVGSEVIADFVAPWKIKEQHRGMRATEALAPLKFIAYTRSGP